MVLLLDLVIKVGLLDSQTKGNGTHHGYVQFMARLCIDVDHMSHDEGYIRGLRVAYLEELKHRVLESWAVALRWPFVLPNRVPIPADFHSFFEVWRLLAQFRYLVSVF